MARLFAIAFVVALHVGAALLLTGRWQPFAEDETARSSAAASTEEPVPEPVTVRTVVDWTRAPAPTPDASRETTPEAVRMVADLEQARAAGRTYAERHVRSIRVMRQRQYGDAITALLDSPIADAWPALEQLAREGDAAAAEALVELAGRCEEAPMRAATYARLADEAAQGLDQLAAAFIRAALEQELAYLEAATSGCRAAGFGTPRLEALLRERGIEPRRGELGIADVWRQFRDAFGAAANPAYGGLFGEPLERMWSGDPLSDDEWITLIAAADDHPAVAYALGACLVQACEGMPDLPSSERTRLMRAAASAGNVHAARALAEDFANAGDLGSAYGWMLFARWADAGGCNPVATTLDLADTLRGIGSLEAVLSPGQRRAGELLGASLVAANAAGTRAVWACPG